MNPKILISTDYYFPGFKAGGPIRSIYNFIEKLNNQYDFYVITRDRDIGDMKAYADIRSDIWIERKGVNILYLSPLQLNIKSIFKYIKDIDFNIIYLSSFFSIGFTLKIIFVSWLIKKKVKIILAPRGQFSQGALGLKSFKKKCYLLFFKSLKLHKNIVWHATTDMETKEIKHIFGSFAKIKVAHNMPTLRKKMTLNLKSKQEDSLQIIFLSRISPKKNLIYAIDILTEVFTENKIYFNIYGPIEDDNYWSSCQEKMKDLPDNIIVEYHGQIKHQEVPLCFANNDLFFFPTLGENYGHVIYESLSAGCPVLLSDQTPWRDLENKKIGWDIQLNEKKRFINIITLLTEMASFDYNIFKRKSIEYIEKYTDLEAIKQSYIELFK